MQLDFVDETEKALRDSCDPRGLWRGGARPASRAAMMQDIAIFASVLRARRGISLIRSVQPDRARFPGLCSMSGRHNGLTRNGLVRRQERSSTRLHRR